MRVVERCRQEAKELGEETVDAKQKRHSAKRAPLSEPVRDCLFGIPGAGKSTCLKLLRRFFEECLGWEDGVQFVYLATQNTMAALVGGQTVHTWGQIPVNAKDAASKVHAKNVDGDVDAVFLRNLEAIKHSGEHDKPR